MTQEMKACGFDLVSISSTFVDRVFALMTAVIAAMETGDVRPNTKNEYSKLRNVLDMRARESYHSENTDDDGVFTGTELALWTTSGYSLVSKYERTLRIVPCHE